MNFWKRIFGGGEKPSQGNTTDNVLSQYGIVSNGKQFIFKGAYVDDMQSSLSTPEECASQTNTLKSSEVCIMLTDPVLIIIANPQRGALAIRTSLPGSRAQDFVDALKPAGVRTFDSGKICLAKLRRGH